MEREAILREERGEQAAANKEAWLEAAEGGDNADPDQLALDIIQDLAANPPPKDASEDGDWTFEEHQHATRYIADLGPPPVIMADDIGKEWEARAEPFHPAGGTHQERQEQPRSKRALIGINPADWEGVEVPPRKWTVPDYIPDETVTLLYADGGTGKSYLDLQLAVARAVAKEWIGLLPEPGRTLILSAEDDADEMHRRLDGIRKFYGAVWSDFKDIRLINLVGEDCVLGELDKGRIHPTEMYHALDAYMTEFRPSPTCLDVLADMYGGDEINRVQVRQFVGLLKKLCLKHHCAILLLAHPSLTGMNTGTETSGSTGWSNAVRSRLYFQTIKTAEGDEPNKDLRTFEGERGGKVDLVWKDGLFRRVIGPTGF